MLGQAHWRLCGIVNTSVAAINPDRPRQAMTNFLLTSLNTENIVNNKPPLVQDLFLNTLRRERVPVSIYLVNGIKLQGQIESFDPYVVLLRNTVTQMVFKHAISTIVPGRNVNYEADGNSEGDESDIV